MIFASPEWAYLFLVIPVLMYFEQRFERQRQLNLQLFYGNTLNAAMTDSLSGRVRMFKRAARWIAMTLIIGGLMQPQWGYEWQEVSRKGVDIVIAFDVSKSMMAEDIKPNRFEAAKREVKSFINSLKGDRVAIVAFAGGAFIQCPLTLDYGTAKLFIDHLSIGSVGRGGTDLGSAVLKSVDVFKGHEKKNRIMILITDGEDHASGIDEAVKAAKENGVIIHAVGIGKLEGAPIPEKNEGSGKSFVKDKQGSVVLSKRDDHSLAKLADATGGTLDSIGSGRFPLETIYQEKIAGLEGREFDKSRTKKFRHHFALFILAAMALLFAEYILPEKKKK